MKGKYNSRWKRFKLRLKIAWRLLWREKHAVVLFVSEKELRRIIAGDKLEQVQIAYFGLKEYQIGLLLKRTAVMIDDIDLICAKAEFDSIHFGESNKMVDDNSV